MITLAELNSLNRDVFIATLADVFEHSPWVAQEAFQQRPFASVISLHALMVAAVTKSGPERQLTLLRAHPELAGRAAVQGTLTDHSTREQSVSGLLDCSPEEFARLQDLNRAYGTRFGFPFVIAVRGLDRTDIIAAFEERLGNTRDNEMSEALRQVARIARLRLDALISATA